MGMECTKLAAGVDLEWKETPASGSQGWMPAQPRGSFSHGQWFPGAGGRWWTIERERNQRLENKKIELQNGS